MIIDVDKDEGAIFEFVFTSIYDAHENMSHHVYAFNRDTIILFAKQHGFDIENITIQIHTDLEEGDIDDYSILKIFRFKSNTNDQEYHIITCQSFVDKAIEDTAQDVTNALWFDTIILRHDIEFIKMINQYIHDLNHVFIMNGLLLDDIWDEEKNSPKFTKSFRLYNEDIYEKWDIAGIDIEGDEYGIEGIIGSHDSEYVMESLFNDSMIGEVQPVTIEAYIKSFTEMITDSYHDTMYNPMEEPF